MSDLEIEMTNPKWQIL